MTVTTAAPNLPPGLDQVANRIARMFKHRRKWARRSGVTCFRVYDRDIPDQPLVVEWYDGDAVVWAYDRARNETAEQETTWLAGVVEATAAGFGISVDRVVLKARRRQRDRHRAADEREGEGQYQPLASDPDAGRKVVKTVLENGLSFEVNLSDYLDTGLFLDHRELRARVRAEVAGKRLLNLFAYTGAFSVHARAGGAAATTTVDLSNTYLDWAGRNLALNGFQPGPFHTLVRADCLTWLAQAPAAGWDVIVCDPPTFSNSTAMRQSFSVERDHPGLIAQCCRCLAPGGTLWFSTNARGFRLADGAVPAGFAASDCTAATTSEDFRDRVPRRVWRFGRT